MHYAASVNEVWVDSLVDRAMGRLLYPTGELTSSPFMVRDYVRWVARVAFEQGQKEGLRELCTTAEVADLLGMNRTTVFRQARMQGLGIRIGRDILLNPREIQKLHRHRAVSHSP